MLVEHLVPLFKVDYLLPRTIATILSARHLEHMAQTAAFPPEVCLAVLFYYVSKISLQENLMEVSFVQIIYISFTVNSLIPINNF